MKETIEELIKSYDPKNSMEVKHALREVLQSIVLIGLSRANFFQKASFYGGTALRIFYGLNRYSEDLDFTLNSCDPSFTISTYLDSIKNVAESYGFDVNVDTRKKSISTPIESAFAKINTYQTFISLNIDERLAKVIHKDEVLKVKFEIDCNPSIDFDVESKWLVNPEFAIVNVLDLPSLFAGKIHAILCRNYKNNVKGRDYYDFLYFIKMGVKPNIKYLREKLIQSSKIQENEEFDSEMLKRMLCEQFNTIDFQQVKEDVRRFLIHNESVDFYCKDLFIDCLSKI